MPEFNCYLAIAYRWGDTNGHQYVVSIHSEEDVVLAAAEEECQDRGGKYGVAVFQWTGNIESAKQVAYFNSLQEEADAPGPMLNWRKEAFQNLGITTFDAHSTGKAHLPDPQDPGRLIRTEAELPQWLQDEVDRRMKFADAMGEHQDKPRQR